MRVLTLLFTASVLAAQVPLQDSRNTFTPDTDTHAKVPEFKTLQEWEQRKAYLRKQILSATGLYPMPHRGAPRAEVFGRLEREWLQHRKGAARNDARLLSRRQSIPSSRFVASSIPALSTRTAIGPTAASKTKTSSPAKRSA